MKKHNKLSIIFTAVISLSLFFTGCFNPVFYQVNNDVESETSLVSGSITSIARYTVAGKEYLVLSGSDTDTKTMKGLLYKDIEDNQHGAWKQYPLEKLPFELHRYDYYGAQEHVGQQILKVLSDSTTLYVVTAEYENDDAEGTNSPSKVHIWATSITAATDGIWTPVEKTDWTDLTAGVTKEYLPLYMKSTYKYSAFNLFSNNAPLQANRTVYLRSGNTAVKQEGSDKILYYKLNGKTLLSDLTPFDTAYINGNGEIDNTATNADALINSAAYVAGKDYFGVSTAATTNETYTTEATKFYFGIGNYIYYGSNLEDDLHRTNKTGSSNISSITYCKDAILFGCGSYTSTTSTNDGGIEKIQIEEDGSLALQLGSFETNAQIQLAKSYIIMTLLNTTPDKSETESNLYATINFVGTASATTASFKNVGLWAYYSNRGNWNRE